ncbi:hypothetical protein M3152_03925 [Sporosarcina luteola]|uniref:hypothetical protein n=1 Tax=Sporosarcina luteola TaxID=582850 RepID=UPI0020414766|nr:hypothetical protein [Sporosarcina luteola]MCM3636857.1 hypothetical protein [Sporosarcina luteola]
MEQGWIKVHRSLLNKPIWTEATSEQKVILVTLLMMATHDERQWEWKGISYSLQPGQMITSLPSLEQTCGKGVSVQKIRTALKRFVKYGFLTDESTNQNRLITIVNWDVYQRDDRFGTGDVTDSQQPANRQLTSNKNVKNEKKEIINYPRAVYDESSEYYRLALRLHEGILNNHSDRGEPDLGNWTNAMKRIVENDQRSIEQVQQLITWSQQHRFWKTVIFSPAALRRNWNQMAAQMRQDHNTRRGQVYQLPNKGATEFVLDLTRGEA